MLNLLCICFELETKINLAPILSAIIAATIVIIGWFVIAYFNRRNEIAKELRGYRLEMLQTLKKLYPLMIAFDFDNTQYTDLIQKTVALLSTCGKDDEQKKYYILHRSLAYFQRESKSTPLTGNDQSLIEKQFDDLELLIVNNIRKEFKSKKYNFKSIKS